MTVNEYCKCGAKKVAWLNPKWPLVCVACSTRIHESRAK